uniref:M28 family metallopeptidase n=1 Tax=Gelidibacter sp. TaxID=2018083 RepID=UPI00404AE25A
MKLLIFSTIISIVGSCSNPSYNEKVEALKDSIVFEDIETVERFSSTITANELKKSVYTLASDSLEGRKTGEIGHHKAAKFLKDFYQREAISSPLITGDYYQNIPEEFLNQNNKTSQNVLAYIKGTDFPDEVLIISGHLDHLGIKDSLVYYGADDNASGTAALMEIAQAFNEAKKAGFSPKRSVLISHFTAEENGLYGSNYYIQNPVFPLNKTVANLNIDMIGRTDRFHNKDDQYIYLIGSDRISKELHYISEAANEDFTRLKLDYKYNADNEPNRYYYRSDHYNFAQKGIPVIFYFNGEHDDYHQATDTPDKLNYPLLEKRTKLIFATAWYIANSEKRVSVEKL